MTRSWKRDQSLNDWVRMFRAIYGNRNSERDQFKIHAHLTEVVAGLYKSVRKGDRAAQATSFLSKSFAWYMALATALGFRDLETTIWHKYPGVCPYCGNPRCSCQPDGQHAIDTALLRRLQLEARPNQRPTSIGAWQQMFLDIYGTPVRLLAVDRGERGDARTVALKGVTRLFEELGELAEAIRLEHVYPVAVRTELADVFAWLLAVASSMPDLLEDPHFNLEQLLWRKYPGKCTYCHRERCHCLNIRVRPSLVASAGQEIDTFIDELTGLRRKEDFERALAAAVADTTERQPLSLLLMDLDHFGKVNNDHGHSYGDEVLGRAAGVFMEVGASYQGTGYRWGGEEFALLLPNRALEEAKACAERIRGELRKTKFTPPSGRHRQTASLGVASFTGALGASVSVLARALFDAADKAVLDAKSAGRDRVHSRELELEGPDE